LTATTIGRVYDETAGTIHANTADTEPDATGKAYNAY